jgi:1-acyl-sn-glycerol-3-phosphate acyltransferase
MIEIVVPFGYVLLKWLVAMPARYLMFNVSKSGENNVPRRGGAILVSNHLSNLDPGAIVVTSNRRVRFMAKAELFRPVLGQLLTLLGTFKVRRLESDRQAVRKAEELIKRGEIVGMFPEGSRSQSGSMNMAHGGTAFIALRTRALIVPVAITGTEKTGGFPAALFRRTKVSVTCGEPFRLEQPDRISSAEVEKATIAMMRRVAELLPEEYRGYYGARDEAPGETESAPVETPAAT